MNKLEFVIYFVPSIILSRAELYLVETETEEETEKQPQNDSIDFRNVTKDKNDHKNETDQQTPALIVEIWRHMTEDKSGNKANSTWKSL